MSTRCNVIIKDGYENQLIFYRHSDGYPEGVAPTLGEFLDLVKQGNIRDNVSQAAGWLILLGYEEYQKSNSLKGMRAKEDLYSWKVGAYEPAPQISPDIDYLYEIDLEAKTLRGWNHNGYRKLGEITSEMEMLERSRTDA